MLFISPSSQYHVHMSETSAEYEEVIRPPKSLDHFVAAFVELPPGDALRREIISYASNIGDKKDINTASGQRDAVLGARDGSAASFSELLEFNRGLVASIAFPYRGIPYENLMTSGEQVLLDAIASYDVRQSSRSFTNFAIPLINDAFEREYGTPIQGTFITDDQYPVYSVYRFAETMAKAVQKERMASVDRQIETKKELLELLEVEGLKEDLLAEIEDLQYLSLSFYDMQVQSGFTIAEYNDKLTKIRKKWNIPNLETLALLCVDAGIAFQTPPLERVEKLTDVEKQVTMLSYKSQLTISRETGIKRTELGKITRAVSAKLRVPERYQMMIMIEMHDRQA